MNPILFPMIIIIIFAELDSEEMDKYAAISRQIAILFSKKHRTKDEELLLEKRLRDRQDILKNASEKYPLFEDLIKSIKKRGRNFSYSSLLFPATNRTSAGYHPAIQVKLSSINLPVERMLPDTRKNIRI